MANILEFIDENQLRHFAGDEQIDLAFQNMISGKIDERILLPDGELVAFWEDPPSSYEMHLLPSGEEDLNISCTCGLPAKGRFCEHLITMLLAWVRDPDSFEMLETDDDDEEDLFPADEEGHYFEDDNQIISYPTGPASPTPIRSKFDPVEEYRQLLDPMPLSELREIARRRGVPISGQRKDPIVAALAEAFARPKSLAELWPSLSPQARLLASILPLTVTRSNWCDMPAAQKIALEFGLASTKEFDQATDELVRNAVVFSKVPGQCQIPSLTPLLLPGDEQFTPAFHPVESLRIEPAMPPYRFLHLTTSLALLLQASGGQYKASPKPDLHPIINKFPNLRDWPYDPKELEVLAREKKAYSQLWDRIFTIPPAQPLLSNESRSALATSLGVEPEFIDFAVRLLWDSKLVQVKPDEPVQIARQSLTAWLQEPLDKRAGFQAALYLNMVDWNEFDLAMLAHPVIRLRRKVSTYTNTYERLLAELATLRQFTLLQVLRQPAERWADFEAFVERAQFIPANRAILERGGSWFVEVNQRRAYFGQPEDWKAVYGAYAEAVLKGPLRWLGVADLAYQHGRLAAFRLTGYGLALFNHSVELPAPVRADSQAALDFDPDGSLILDPGLAQGDLAQVLPLLGEAEISGQGRIRYRPNARGASRAFEAGWTAVGLIALFENAARKPLPHNLSSTLQDWQKNFGDPHFYEQVALLELGDDYVLNELLANTSLAKYLLYRFSPRLVALLPEGVEPLREELVYKGYTPKIQ